MMMEVRYADGTTQNITTDSSWQGASGPLVYSDMLQGEFYDARLEQPSCDSAKFKRDGWKPVEIASEAANGGQIVDVTDKLGAALKNGALSIRSGNDMAGDPAFKTVKTLRVESTLNGVAATQTVAEDQMLELPGLMIGSDIAKTGSFITSTKMVDQLQSNIDWGQRGNFLSVPTDCPQRDESLGWLGDAQVLAKTATHNHDVAGFFEKWLQDVKDAQAEDGGYPNVAPRKVDQSNGAPVSTGFIGVGYLCPTLSDNGLNDVAYQLLLNDTFPSWGFSIKQGATTIWERWDGWTPDKGFQDVGMNSFNHYSLGSVGEWLFGHVGGIQTDPDFPGFERILVRPQPGPGLTFANTSFDSVRGRIVSNWKTEAGATTYDIAIPANTTAQISLPSTDAKNIKESGQTASQAPCVKFVGQEKGNGVFEVGSGTYQFVVAP